MMLPYQSILSFCRFLPSFSSIVSFILHVALTFAIIPVLLISTTSDSNLFLNYTNFSFIDNRTIDQIHLLHSWYVMGQTLLFLHAFKDSTWWQYNWTCNLGTQISIFQGSFICAPDCPFKVHLSWMIDLGNGGDIPFRYWKSGSLIDIFYYLL